MLETLKSIYIVSVFFLFHLFKGGVTESGKGLVLNTSETERRVGSSHSLLQFKVE